jgi:glutaredoxin
LELKEYLRAILFFAGVLASIVALPSASSCKELLEPASIDLSSALDFEEYVATGSGRQIDETFRRIDELLLSDEFISAVRAVEGPTTLVVYGDMSCPDCAAAVPFVEAIRRTNPEIVTLYFTRTDEAEITVKNIAGVYKTPTIFAADPGGTLGREFLLEFPDSVRKLVDAASDSDSRRTVIREFRAGKYAADLEADLIKVLRGVRR